MTTTDPILPGAVIGVLGSGQLGRMFAIAARRMGYRVHTYSPDSDTPTGQVADVEVRAAYGDLNRLREFASNVRAITFEFENVPAAAAAAVAEIVPVRPAGAVLHITQHRLREKTFLSEHGLPVTPFHSVRSRDDLYQAAETLGFPCILKTADFGYDGKGQTRINSPEELPLPLLEGLGEGDLPPLPFREGLGEGKPSDRQTSPSSPSLSPKGERGDTPLPLREGLGEGEAPNAQKSPFTQQFPQGKEGEYILEAFIDFDRELSVVAARGIDGSFTHWGVIENTHHHHILDTSVWPAELPHSVQNEAIEIARTVLEQLDVVGVLCVEFFLARDGRLLINELAPRPHNSGHLTFDASLTSQFEQQVRAVCGLPLGSTEMLRPAAMANLLGDLWNHGEPNWPAACAFPQVKLHLYGKQQPRPARKMGHLTALATTPAEALEIVRSARAALTTHNS